MINYSICFPPGIEEAVCAHGDQLSNQVQDGIPASAGHSDTSHADLREARTRSRRGETMS